MWVKLRTTPEQRAAWYAKAEAKGVNFSELARQALDGITVRRRAQLRRIDPAFLWVCVSPACDTGPDQTRTVQDGRLRFAALKLYEETKNRMPKNVQINRYVFLKSDDDIEVYSINKEPEAMPDIGIFYADNLGIFHADMQLKVSRAEEVTLTNNDVETKDFIMQSYDIKVVAHLRYEYALNLIHRLGGAQTRVGLDFAGK